MDEEGIRQLEELLNREIAAQGAAYREFARIQQRKAEDFIGMVFPRPRYDERAAVGRIADSAGRVSVLSRALEIAKER